jgi:transposase-like protein
MCSFHCILASRIEGKKQKQFSLEEKQNILEEADIGVKKCEIARKYKINPFMLSAFIKNRVKNEKKIDSDAICLPK